MDTDIFLNHSATAAVLVATYSPLFDNESFPDVSNLPYPGPILSLPLWEITVKILVYSIIILLALVGNILVVYVVLRIKRMRTTTNYYLVNLAISDLMVTVSCSWVHLVDDIQEGWPLGAFFCKFNSFAQVLSFLSSILTLTLISCDRFFGIVFAMKARMTERRSTVFIIAIWLCAVGISSPLLFFRQQESRQWLDHVEIWCDDKWPVLSRGGGGRGEMTHNVMIPSRKAYYTFMSVVLYFLPILVMSIAYSFIIWKLSSSKAPGERVETMEASRSPDKNKKKVVVMLIAVLFVFSVCWLPFQVAILYAEHRSDLTEALPPWYSDFYFFANYLAFANSAFNPVIYTGFNNNFRKAFKSVFGCGRERQCQYNQISGSLAAGHNASVLAKYKEARGSSLTKTTSCGSTPTSKTAPGNNFHTTIVTKI